MTLIINKLELKLATTTAKTVKKKAEEFEKTSGFHSVSASKIENGICKTKFIFNNYLYLRFADTSRIVEKGLFTYSVYPYNTEFIEDEILYIEESIKDPEYLKFTRAFHLSVKELSDRIIQKEFEKYVISPTEIHQYVFKLHLVKKKNEYIVGIKMQFRDKYLPAFRETPYDMDFTPGFATGAWTKKELEFIRQYKATLPELPAPLNQTKFVQAVTEYFGESYLNRAIEIWSKRKELGIPG